MINKLPLPPPTRTTSLDLHGTHILPYYVTTGVSAEAAAFAAHEKLDNLIVLYDSNDVTLDAMADKTQSEDIAARYKAYGE